jgi:hypothetical protein
MNNYNQFIGIVKILGICWVAIIIKMGIEYSGILK